MNKRAVYYSVTISLIIGIALILLVSVYFTSDKKVIYQKLEGGTVTLSYMDEFNGITIANASTTSDVIGMKLDGADQYFDFSVITKINEASKIDYEISVVKDINKSTTIDDYVRVYLEKLVDGSYSSVFGPNTFEPITKDSSLGSKMGSMILYKERKTKSGTDNYRLRVWLSDSANIKKGSRQNITILVYVNGKAS